MDEVTEAQRVAGTHLIACALWLGLTYGLIEGLGFSLLRLIPWAAAPLNGTTLHILWIDPLAYGTTFGLIGLTTAVVARARPTVRWDIVLVFVLVWLAAFLFANLQGELVANYAAAALGCGIAIQVARWYRTRRNRWFPVMVRTLPHASGLIIVLALVVWGGSRFLETAAVRQIEASGAAHPNVLFLLIDSQRADHLSSYGYGRRTTPRLDQLAREGVLFEHAQSPSSLTLPSP